MVEQPESVWYVSYGSNMCADRFGHYLSGGTPAGARGSHPGCRDHQAPVRSAGYELAGGIYFATESAMWGGGRAFYDPELPGIAAVRAYLITCEQFADIAAQEMYRPPGKDLDLSAVLATGRAELGPGRYETLLHLSDLAGRPMLTFTAPWRASEVRWNAPSASYLCVLAAGLQEAHEWDTRRIASYLAGLPGARGSWTPASITTLLDQLDNA